jgi:Na+/H+-dicarboxylate symporter
MSFTLRVLIGLLGGLAIGLGVSVAGVAWLAWVPALVEPIGILFVNAIRMAVIPLVVASLVVGVTSMGDVRKVGTLGGRALVLFVVFVAVATLFGAALADPLLARLRIDRAVASGLRAGAFSAGQSASESAGRLPSVSEWMTDLVPVNVFRAASDGAILPLIVFALAVGLALTAVGADRRQPVIAVFQGIADAMLILVGWVLKFTPVGVFALAVPLAARVGLAAVGALLSYIVLLSAISAAFIVLLYPVAVVMGRVPLSVFTRGAAPCQAVAFASRSSLAALPAAIEGARTELRLPDEITSFFLPLAASMFRVGGAIAQVVSVLFLARLYGIDLNPAQLATVVVTVVPTSFSIPGIPGGAIIVMAPVLASVGLPVEGIGILLGVDTISDMFRTTANVTGWLTVASILGRGCGRRDAGHRGEPWTGDERPGPETRG